MENNKTLIKTMNISKKFSLRNFREQMAFYGINLCNAEEERVYLETVSDLEERALEALNNIGEIKQRLNQFKQHFNDFISEIKKRKLYLNKMLIDDQQKDNIMATRKINYFSKKLEELLFQDKLSEQMVINNVLVNSFEEELQDFYDIYRYLLSFLASTSTRLEWQSVSFESSKRPEIFLKEEFDYKGTLGYKRVHYPALFEYEDWILEGHVDSPAKEDLCCFVTNSGQGAFITVYEVISKFLLDENDKILLSKMGYYETRWVVTKSKGFKIKTFDLTDTETIIEQILSEKPSLVILEPIYCEDTIRLIDLTKVLKKLNEIKFKSGLYLIIDVSMLSGAVEPFSIVNNPNLHIFYIESLIKYRQYGLDKVNAGFIVAEKKFRGKIITARASIGAILHNIDLETLPRISRSQYINRMIKVSRNAKYLAENLQVFADRHPKLIFKGIEYPGLKSHPDFKVALNYPFLNGLFTFKLDKDYYKNFATLLYFIKRLLENAKKKNVSVNHGTSFGFDWTRIAVADTEGGEFTNPFIRMSVGRETMKDIVILSDVLKETILEVFKV